MSLLDRYFIKMPRLRRAVTRLLEGNRELDVPMLGTVFRLHSIKEHGYLRSSRFVNRSALLREELPVLIHLATLLADGDTFVDIGANVGIYCLTLARAQRILPQCQFYAFEANPDTFSRLLPGAREAGVRTHNVALSDHTGALDFVPGAVSHVFTTLDNASEYSIRSTPVTVECRRLDEFGIVGDSLVLKIDVEGQERQVLEGSRRLFEARRIKAVYLDGFKDRSVASWLSEQGFTLLDGKTLEPADEHTFGLLAIRLPAHTSIGA